MTNATKTCLAALAGLLVFVSGSRARGEVHEHVEPYTIPDQYSEAVLGQSKVRDHVYFDVPQFDPAMGTLTGVSISFTTHTTDVTLLLDSEVPYEQPNTKWLAKALFWVDAPDLTPWYVWGHRWQWAALGPDDDSEPDFSGGDSLVISGAVPDLNYDRSPTSVAAYEGTGTAAITLNKTTRSEPAYSNTATRFDHTGLTTGQLRVSYEFTPIPEPSSIILLLAGAVVLAIYPRRQSKRPAWRGPSAFLRRTRTVHQGQQSADTSAQMPGGPAASG